MQMLQRLHINLAALQCLNSLSRSPCGSQRRNGGNPRGHGRSTNRLLVKPRFQARGRIDDELNALALDEVDYVGPSFFYFIDALHIHIHPRGFDYVGGTGRGHEFESHVDKLARDLRHLPLVVVGHADEDCSLRGQLLARS